MYSIKYFFQLGETTTNIVIPIYDSLLLVTAIVHILTAQYLDSLIHCGCISSILWSVVLNLQCLYKLKSTFHPSAIILFLKKKNKLHFSHVPHVSTATKHLSLFKLSKDHSSLYSYRIHHCINKRLFSLLYQRLDVKDPHVPVTSSL